MVFEKPWDHGPLKVHPSGKYLVNGDRPFFWLGDTAWLLCPCSSEEEARIYLRNRKEKGFNVIQTVLIHSLPEEKDSSLPKNSERDIRDPEYWNYCDRVIRIAEETGLYLALLPAWGSIVQENFLNEDNVEKYVRFLAERYGDRPNIIWILGGDIRGDKYAALYRKAGQLFKELNPDKLVSFHPFGRTSSSLWFHEENWLDFNMYQSGHRRYDQASLGAWDDNKQKETFFGEDCWKYADRDRAMVPRKPTVDAEPSYEWILQGLHDRSQPYWQAWDARRYAYWDVFAGTMGHTYGHNSIQQFYQNPLVSGSFGVRWRWDDAIHHVGSDGMGILRNLMESVDWYNGVPADDWLVSGQREKEHRIALLAGVNWLFAYDATGEKFELNLEKWKGREIQAWWMDPAGGCRSYLAELTGKNRAEFRPVPKFSADKDWVLILKAV